ncbi:M16 family metallopeptidase [Anaeromicropila populeti]|uniref:Predicted Zn-dependent peptidase n=1 Tax=Anaeromicropila populeti TaxID=37658 RepID=A0A1I6KHU3_9FIRM|nr:pitrilysin family protein [Anaeromicropila populeti]SFR90734.1 Predicted Zn-dependent peptidase [Anaeromicropila populeti]
MVQIKKLSNGIPVLLERMDSLRSVSLGIYVRAGSVYETGENNGISHVIEHMIFKSTKNRTSKQLADDMAKTGGNLNAFTEKECTSFYTTTLEELLPQTIELLGDMLFNGLFLEEEIEKEKGVILEEIDMYDDSPEDLVHEMLQKVVWKEHPLGFIISGEKKTVSNFTRNDLLQFKENTYTSDQMVISIAGKFQIERVMEELEKHFSHFAKSRQKIEIPAAAFCPVTFQRKKDIEQVYLNLAFEGVSYESDEKYILYLLNVILGGSDNSRLFQRLREDKGLTYSIYSYESLYECGGMFHIDAVLNPTKLPVVLNEMEMVLDNFCKEGVTQAELDQAKQLMKIDLIIGNESTKSKVYNNGKTYLLRNQIKTVDEILQCLNQVTEEDIQKFAQTHFMWDRKAISCVGNIPKKEQFSFV